VPFEAVLAELLCDLDAAGGGPPAARIDRALGRAGHHFGARRIEILPLGAGGPEAGAGGARSARIAIPLFDRRQDREPRSALVAERPGREWRAAEVRRLRLVAALIAAALRQSEAEFELRESQIWLYLAMESATFGTWDWHIPTDRVRYTAPFDRTRGTPEIRETEGGDWFRVTHPDDIPAARAEVERAIAGESDGFAFAVRSQHPPYRAGEWIWFYSRGRVVERDASGRATRIMGVHEDVSESKRKEAAERAREERFAQASRLLALSALTSSIAHEINQPLAAMTGFLQSARRLLDQGEGRREEVIAALDRSVALGERAAEIVRRLRRLLRREQPLRERIEVPALLADVRDQLQREARAAGVELRVAETPALPELRGDRIQIEQALINLGRNAIEELAGRGEGPRVVTLDAEADERWARLRVADTGPGIPESSRRRLFQPFHSTKSSGSGLGLVICESIAELHGGRARLERSGPEGSAFLLELPIAAEEPDAGTA